jgi:DNA-binding transcriptional regulator YiaG
MDAKQIRSLVAAYPGSSRILAARIGVNDRTLRRWVVGASRPHKIFAKRLESLAKAYGVSVSDTQADVDISTC